MQVKNKLLQKIVKKKISVDGFSTAIITKHKANILSFYLFSLVVLSNPTSASNHCPLSLINPDIVLRYL